MSRYVINILACQDLNQIADYFAAYSLEVGGRFFTTFDRKCKQLVMFPNSGKNYSAIRSDLRVINLENHIIFYRVLDNGIEVLRVLSGRRNLSSLFED
jgi:toxin ParE1/3/4